MKCVPHLWFDDNAVEAVAFYCSLFENSRLQWQYAIKDTPSGDCDLLAFELDGQAFSAISAGPYYQLNESVSIMVTCSSRAEVLRLYQAFMQKGDFLMPLQEYAFNPYYAWVRDAFGVTWQLLLDENQESFYHFDFCLLFASENCGKASEALDFYAALFDTSIESIALYQEGQAHEARAKVSYASLNLESNRLVLMDHAYTGDKLFNEAFSFMILCDSQDEIDLYWQALSAVPEAEQCGWCKDSFGLSWQILPSWLMSLYENSQAEKLNKIQKKLLKMRKIDSQSLKDEL
ncbi:VOC family protein [Streptococcus uberis]|uniref:VOC family protein n=1 Tax=Streptococcus uberis TaxID=1349 RepID=UPI003D35D822